MFWPHSSTILTSCTIAITMDSQRCFLGDEGVDYGYWADRAGEPQLYWEAAYSRGLLLQS